MNKIVVIICLIAVPIILLVGGEYFVDAMGTEESGTTYIVNNTSDSGEGTLRQAMESAQSGDTITFDPVVFPVNDPAAITLSTVLPRITCGNLVINGTGAGVILDGEAAEETTHRDGFYIFSDNNQIKGSQILNFSDNGVHISMGATHNLISENVIGGDEEWGVLIEGTGTMSNPVIGNLVGMDASGIASMSNVAGGVSKRNGAQFNTIGGSPEAERNFISGNQGTGENDGTGDGTQIYGFGTEHNIISGNYIGVDISGAQALFNGRVGVSLGGSYNIVEGSTPGERNVISGNLWEGIIVSG